MWDVRNDTPFAHWAGFYRDHEDRSFWGLWIKAAFALRENRPPLFLPDAALLKRAPEHSEVHPEILLSDTDLTPSKVRVDLLINASATQPLGDDLHPINFKLGDWKKQLVLAPPQRWNWRGRAVLDTDVRRATQPLDARISYGGPGNDENPLGTGNATERDQPASMPPVLLYANQSTQRRGQPVAPVILGPIPQDWPMRQRLAGTFDEAWRTTRAPCLPRDFRPDYWQSAPRDQQLSRQPLGASVFEAGGLETTRPVSQPSRFPLTDLDLACATRIKGRWQVAQPELQTIRVDVTQRMLSLVYLAAWEVPRASSDVDFDLSKVSLNSTAGFRVRPEDSHLFSTTAHEAMS